MAAASKDVNGRPCDHTQQQTSMFHVSKTRDDPARANGTVRHNGGDLAQGENRGFARLLWFARGIVGLSHALKARDGPARVMFVPRSS